MQERGVSVRELAESLVLSYEHVRKIVRGEAIPSKHLLRSVAELLQLDLTELESLADVDKVRKKFPHFPTGMLAKNPELEPIERFWDVLTPEQRQDLAMLAQRWAGRNKATAKTPVRKKGKT